MTKLDTIRAAIDANEARTTDLAAEHRSLIDEADKLGAEFRSAQAAYKRSRSAKRAALLNEMAVQHEDAAAEARSVGGALEALDEELERLNGELADALATEAEAAAQPALI